MTGLLILVGVLGLATAFGLWRRGADGRVRRIEAPATAVAAEGIDGIHAADIGAALGDRATLVQFSSESCSSCRATRRLLDDIVASRPGVGLVEVDAPKNLDLARRHNVMRTPTVIILDADGVIRGRASGTPRVPEIVAVLDAIGS